MSIKKRHLYFLAFLIALVGIGFVIAASPNPGHSWLEIENLPDPSTIWTSVNDGAGSGLDADTVDGKNANDLSRRFLVSWGDLSLQAAGCTGNPLTTSARFEGCVSACDAYCSANQYKGGTLVQMDNLNGLCWCAGVP